MSLLTGMSWIQKYVRERNAETIPLSWFSHRSPFRSSHCVRSKPRWLRPTFASAIGS